MRHLEIARKITSLLDKDGSYSQLDKDLLIRLTQRLYDIIIDLPTDKVEQVSNGQSNKHLSDSQVKIISDQLEVEANALYEEAEKSIANKIPQVFEHKPTGDSQDERTIFDNIPQPIQNEQAQEVAQSAAVYSEIVADAVPEVQNNAQAQVNTAPSSNDVWTKEVSDINQELDELFEVSQSNDLFGKLASTPIQNLKQSIGINDRLLYTKVLFNGKDTDYQNLVSELNDLTSFEKAKQILYPVMQSNEWQTSRKEGVARSFIQIVKRRYA